MLLRFLPLTLSIALLWPPWSEVKIFNWPDRGAMLSIYVRTGVVCLSVYRSVRLSVYVKEVSRGYENTTYFYPIICGGFFFSLFFFGGNYQNVHRFDSIRVDRLLFMANGYKKYLNLNFKFKYYLFRGLFILILWNQFERNINKIGISGGGPNPHTIFGI